MAEDTHLLGIGFKHIKGGEDEFVRGAKRVQGEGERTAKSLNSLDGANKRAQGSFRSFVAPLRSAYNHLQQVAVAVSALTVILASGVVANARFQAGLVGVGKTANLEGAQLAGLGREVDSLSRKIPVATGRLLEIAQSAGQLGVQGSANIAKFTDTVALLGQASDLGGEEAATALARILNVTGESVDRVDVLASVIVALGNNFAASESQIAHHTGEVARATAVYDIGSSHAAAYGTTLAAFGVRAELAGSAVGRSFRVIESAVKSGGDQMTALASVSRASSEEITRAWGESPVAAFNLLLQGLREVQAEGGNVAAELAGLGLAGEEILKVIPVLAKEYGTLARAQRMAAEETGNATALTEEAARNNATLASQSQILRNQLTSVLRLVGEGMTPAVEGLVAATRGWVEQNRGLFTQLGQAGGAALKAVGAAFRLVAENIDLVKAALVSLAAAWLTLKALSIGAAALEIGKMWLTFNRAMTVSQLVMAEVSLGVGALRAAFASLTATMFANPFVLVAAAVAVMVGLVYSAVQASRSAAEEEERYAESVRSGSSAIADSVRDRERLLGVMGDQLSTTKEMAAAAAELNGRQVEFSRTQTALLAEQEAELRGLEEQYQRVNAERDAFQLGGAFYASGGASLVRVDPELQEIQERMALVRAEADRTREALEDLWLQERIDAAMAAHIRQQERLREEQGAQARATEEQRKRFQEAAEAISQSTADSRAMVAAISLEGDARRAAVDSIEVENRVRAAAKDLTAGQGAELRRLTVAQVAAERVLSGAESISSLEDQLSAQLRLTRAATEGARATAEASADLEAEAMARDAAAAATGRQAEEIRRLAGEIVAEKIAEESARAQTRVNAQIDDLARLNTAYERGADAVRDTVAVLRVESAARAEAEGFTGQHADELERLAAAREREQAILSANGQVAQLEAETSRLREMAALRAQDFATEKEYAEAVRLVNVEKEVRVALLALEAERSAALAGVRREDFESEEAFGRELSRVNGVFGDLARRTTTAIRLNSDLDASIRTTADSVGAASGAWITLGQVISDVAFGAGSDISRLVQSIGQLAAAWEDVKKAEDGTASEKALAGAQFGGSVFGVGQGLGLWQGQGGETAFGGKGEGDYADVGAVIGGIVGSLVPVIGTALGAVLGGVIGGAIKSGADEGLATLRQVGDEVSTWIYKSEGGLGEVIGGVGDSIGSAVQDAVALLGGELGSVGQLGLKVRGDVITITSGNLKGRFKDIDNAVEFGVIHALRNADVSGLSPAAQAAIRDRTVKTAQQLQDNIAAALEIDNLEVPAAAREVGEAFGEVERRFQQLSEAAGRWGLSLETLQQIGEDYGQNLQLLRDDITGVTLSEKEQFEQRRKIFNQKLDLARLDLESELAFLQQQLAVEKEWIALGGARGAAQRLMLEDEGLMLETQLKLNRAALRGGTEFANGVAEIEARITGVQAAIDSLPKEIGAGDFRGSGGGSRRQRRESLDETLTGMEREALPEFEQALLAVQDQFAALREESIRLGEGVERVNDLERDHVALLRERYVTDVIDEFLPSGGREDRAGGLSSYDEALAALTERFDAARDANEALAGSERELEITRRQLGAAEQEAVRQLAQSVIDSFGFPLDRARQQVQGLADAIGFLSSQLESGAVSADQMADFMAQLGARATSELYGIAAGVLDTMGATGEAARFRAAIEEANFHIQLAQLNFLYQEYLALGLLTDAVQANMEELLGFVNDPSNWPDFSSPDYYNPPPPPPAGGGGSAGGPDEDERRRQQILDQIEAWNSLSEPQTTRRLRDLNEVFVEMRADAVRLGISVQDLASAYGVAVGDFWDQALAPYEDQNLTTTVGRLAEINQTFDEMTAAAQQYGGDLARIEAARLRAIEQFWDEALEPLRDYQDSLLGGAQGGVAPEQRLLQAQARFDDVSQRALAGDLDAMAQLPGVIDALLQEARSYYGSGAAYQALFASVHAIISQILAQGGGSVPVPGTVGGGGPDTGPKGGAGGVANDVFGALTGGGLSGGPTPALLPPAPLDPEDRVSAEVRSLVRSLEEDRAERRGRDDRLDEAIARADRLADLVAEQADQIAGLVSRVDDLVEVLTDRAASA